MKDKFELLKIAMQCNCCNGITIWKFRDAPKVYQDLSRNYGDEDWVAFVPDALKGEYIGFLERGSAFGCSKVEEHCVEGGMIYIGCHS